jgi:triosephosphate isomerase
MALSAIRKTIDRANELDMLSFGCADSIAEVKAIAQLHPDIINPEPNELIGSGSISDMSYVHESIKVIKDIYPDILVEQAAGVSSGKQVYDLIYAGAEGTGAASGIIFADDPFSMVDEMVGSVRKAHEDLLKK